MNIDTAVTLGVIFFMLYSAVFFFLIFFDRRKDIKKDPAPKKEPLISIVIPVYENDKKEMIEKAVISALAVDYPKKEIILSWNGPKNENFEVCREFEKKKLIKVLFTLKPGKAAGMNNALKSIKGEYFCCLDADSYFETDALNRMVGYMNNEIVASVTSAMKVDAPKTLVQKIQWVEYIFAIYLRKMMSYINCLYVIPGPGSMYRTEIIRKVGGFDENNLTEDMEIAFRLQKSGYKIANSSNAYVKTNAPPTLSSLIKQRVRWFVGFIDNVRKYKFFMLNPRYGSLGMYIIPTALLWIGVLFYTFVKLTFSVFRGIEYPVKTLLLTGLHLDVLWKQFLESIYFQPTFMTWFIVLFVAIGIAAIILSLWASNEKVDFRHKYIHYTSFMFIYTFLMIIFWFASFAYMIVRNRTKSKIRW